MKIRSVVNFRDVGGQPTTHGRRVRRGVVYRSGHLADLSDDDAARLEQVPVRMVIDFRTNLDISDDGGTGRLPSARRVHLPMGDPATGDDLRALLSSGDREALARHLGGGQAEDMMIRAARALVLQQREGYAGMLRHLASPDATPAIVHCSAGKDRTGWAASLLLLIAGVAEELVLAHYAESDEHRAADNERVLRRVPPGVDPEWIRPFLECRPAYARASFEAVADEWGDIETYVTAGLGVSGAELDRLRDRLVE